MTLYMVVEFWSNAANPKFEVQYICQMKQTAENWIREQNDKQNKPANRFAIITGEVIE